MISLTSWLREPKRGLKCAAVTPVGPGHAERARDCRASIEAAWREHKGPFSQLAYCFVDDGNGTFGRSKARNIGARNAFNAGADWIFFLDADDLMAPRAFAIFSDYIEHYDAVWGLLANKPPNATDYHIRFPQALTLESLDELLLLDPFLTLLMGHFVRANAAIEIPFNEAMDAGEDFDYYIRAWENYRCIKIAQLLSINRSDIKSTGPRPATANQWRAAATKLLSAGLRRNGLQRHSSRAIAAVNRCSKEAQAFSRARNLVGLDSPFSLSRHLPYRGFVDVSGHEGDDFVLFDNSDDLVCAGLAWTGEYKPLSTDFWQMLARTSNVILDIGAYNGYFGFLASRVAAKSNIHCFEPLAENYARMRLNITVNGFNNIHAVNAAEADSEGIAALNIYSTGKFFPLDASLGSRQAHLVFRQPVNCMCIDAYIERNQIDGVGLAKISVEGGELAVLTGMQQTIAKCHPDLLIEVSDGQSQAQLNALLRQHGYRFYTIYDSRQEIEATADLAAGSGNRDLNRLASVREAGEIARLTKQVYGFPLNFG